MKIRNTNSIGEIKVPADIKEESFVMIVNSIAKSPILDVPGVSGYIIVIICF